jgi:signal peptidase II
MLRLRKLTLVWFAIAAAVLMLDQWSKLWIVERYAYGDTEFFSSFFNLVRVHNYGAAFSFLSDAGGWQRWGFSLLAIAISAMIIVWIARLPVQRKLEGLALALILGGALGNLYDRLTLGYVVDFLDFHWSGKHFPAFNVADAGISVGAAILIFDTLVNSPDADSKE